MKNIAEMQRGTYYIGDPCYITRGDPGYEWIEKVWNHFYGGHKGLITVGGVSLFLENTFDGDGVYDGYFVDSGCLCVIRIDELTTDDRFNFRNMTIRGTRFAMFDHDFEVSYDEGTFTIDHQILIRTKY
jgi:hypothetical protein